MNLEYKRIERQLSQIGAKIANATEMSRQARTLANSSESILIDAQKEIDALYISLEDADPPKARRRKVL